MKKLNIGLLIISDEWGGAEEVVYHLAKHLKRHNVNISLFINNELVGFYNTIRGLSIHTLGPFNTQNKYLRLYYLYNLRRNLIKILDNQHLDVIHAHLEGSLFVYEGLLNKFNVPVIFTLHGSEIKNFFEKRGFLVYHLLKRMFEKAKLITSPSHWQVGELEKKYKIKTRIISNALDTKQYKPIKIEREKNVILYVGRFVESKGVIELIKIAKELPQYEFWFVGWGPLGGIINFPNTKNLGIKNREELVKLYNKATICCFPSYYESFGIVGLEAMACGKPIIATKKGFTEFLENNKDGLVIEAGNPKQLKESIVKLMENSQLRKVLGKDARKKALKYDWREIIRKYYDLYMEAVAK